MIITHGIKLNNLTIDPGPVPVPTSFLIVAGGGGGSGWIGVAAPGAGAGGLLTGTNLPLYIGETYVVTVGAGGTTNVNDGNLNFNNSGSNSLISGGDIDPGGAPSAPAYGVIPGYIRSFMIFNGYCSFIADYGVWTDNFVGSTNITYTTQIFSTQTYILRMSVRDSLSVYINGNLVGTQTNWTSYTDVPVDIDAGLITIQCVATSTAGFNEKWLAAALYDPYGNMVWSTRAVSTNPLVALGGGGGIYSSGGYFGTFGNGYSGGSGGGEVGYAGGNAPSAGLGAAGQGNDGGAGASQITNTVWGAGGGGGAGGAGQNGGGGPGTYAFYGGYGGPGLSSDITGTTTWYAGGGGGAGGGSGYPAGQGGAGGQGGGGNGGGNGPTGYIYATDAEQNTGGGGGGGMSSPGGNGGSGIVVLRALYPAQATTGNPTVTQDGDFYIYTFTESGTIQF